MPPRIMAAVVALAASSVFAPGRVHADFTLYVAEYAGSSIQTVTGTGAVSTFIQPSPRSNGIAFDSAGNCYVTSEGMIQEYSASGAFLRTVAYAGAHNIGILNDPQGIALDSSNNIYVAANQGVSAVYEFSQAGDLLRTYTGFVRPEGVLLDGSGNLYVSDYAAGTISVFSPAGVLSRTLTSSNLTEPYQMVLDKAGNLYVTDGHSGVIEKFSAAGADLGVFASSGFQDSFGLAYDPGTGDFYQSVSFQSVGTLGTIRHYSSTGVYLGDLATRLTDPNALVLVPSAVPEPASLALVLVGVAGAAGTARCPRGRAAA